MTETNWITKSIKVYVDGSLVFASSNDSIIQVLLKRYNPKHDIEIEITENND